MPVEPPRKITETQIIHREENATFQQRKKKMRQEEQKKEPEKTGKVDIKV